MVGLSNDFVRYVPDMVNYYRNILPKAIPVNKTTNNTKQDVYNFYGDIKASNCDTLQKLIDDLHSLPLKMEQRLNQINR